MRVRIGSLTSPVLLLLIAQTVLARYADKGDIEALLPVPKRELEWGDVNFISTSDTHGMSLLGLRGA